ncbi:MAG: hypothetical protein IJS17_05365 [Clostridia bacterium]|nr:hypothetical protein [Clostridia bacterium]
MVRRVRKMIGLGTWKCKINHTFYSGSATLVIKDKNGEYDFHATLDDDTSMPEYTVSNVTENGNCLEGELKISMIPMKMKFHAEINGDTMTGGITVPFVGEIKLENATRVD